MSDTVTDPTRAVLLQHIEAYEKEAERKWGKDAEKIIDRYKDERPVNDVSKPRMNLLWSNVETLKPFLYSATPKPIVSTRHDDAAPAARIAGEVLERALAYTIAEGHFGSTLRNARDDYLLAGRGTGWVRYKPTFVPATVQISEADVSDDPAMQAVTAGEGDDGTEQVQDVVGWEETVSDYVHWRDFGHNIAPTWEEVDIVWRRVPMDRDALKERFRDVGEKVGLDWRSKDGKSTEGDDVTARAAVYECWWKSKRKAFWLTKTYATLLDEKDDPLKLDHFFPCPRPIYATLTTDSLHPTPDFKQYRDQANEIDDLTWRIASLTSAVKAAGVYDSSFGALATLLQEGHDNTLIPVDSYAAMKEKGGLVGAIELLPMQEIVNTLLALHDAREKQKQDLYEVTGMSDIIRGNTAPSETATAQQIKSNFATKRLAERQMSVARFASNMIAIMGNIIAMHFSMETLIAMTGMKLLTEEQKAMARAAQQEAQQPQSMPAAPGAPPAPVPPKMGHNGGPPIDDDVLEALDKPSWEEIMELLRNEPQRRFAISVDTDSLVLPDDQQEQQARTQFLEAVGGFLQQAMQAAEANPAMVPLLGHMLMFAVRGFRIGRDLDDVFQTFVDEMEKQAKEPRPPKPDPAMAKVQGELQIAQAKMQFEQQQAVMQVRHDRALQLADQRHRHRMEIAAAQRDADGAQSDGQMDVLRAHVDAATAANAAQIKAQTDILIARINAFAKIEAAGEAKGATHDTAAEQREEAQGA